MPITQSNGSTTITGDSIQVYRALAIHGVLKMSARGMKNSRQADWNQAARDLCGSSKKTAGPLLADYRAWLIEQDIIQEGN